MSLCHTMPQRERRQIMSNFAANVFFIAMSVFYGVLSVIAVISFVKYLKEKDDEQGKED